MTLRRRLPIIYYLHSKISQILIPQCEPLDLAENLRATCLIFGKCQVISTGKVCSIAALLGFLAVYSGPGQASKFAPRPHTFSTQRCPLEDPTDCRYKWGFTKNSPTQVAVNRHSLTL